MRRGVELGPLQNASDTLLESRDGDQAEFVIISIDLVGSTALSQRVPKKTNARIIQVYSDEIATAATLFHGFPLKFMGDGILLYFPAPSFISKNDLAVDCALLLRGLVLDGLNPILTSRGLPPLGCRIGIDGGEAIIQAIGARGITKHMDLIGETINLATKIEKCAEPNAIFVGETTAMNTHVMWRRFMTEVASPSNWEYVNRASKLPYRIFKLNL